ncbi:MAG: prolyl oligopeptidase family serine peptidase [Planctomycetales bacterium]|nr:prolyl oligopeptidase family serine peptidase [Planctomycetales bacterium]
MALFTATRAANAQTSVDRTFTFNDRGVMSYRLYFPPGYDAPGKTFPIVVWLHGSGGSGFSLPHGLLDAATSERFASFVLAPTASRAETWTTCDGAQAGSTTVDCPPGTTRDLQGVLDILDELETEFSIDASRRIVTGESAGGVGTFEALVKHPDVFSTAVSVAGGYDPSLITEPISARIWALHGHNDDYLLPSWSSSTVAAINALGGSAIYQEPSGDHGAPFTDDFFRDLDGDLYPWMFEGVEPSLAKLYYDPATGDTSIDASTAPGGVISRFYVGLDPTSTPTLTEINGDPLTIRGNSLFYDARSSAGFSGIIDLGPILPMGMDFVELHRFMRVPFKYDSPFSTTQGRLFQLVVVPEPSAVGLSLGVMAILACAAIVRRRPSVAS